MTRTAWIAAVAAPVFAVAWVAWPPAARPGVEGAPTAAVAPGEADPVGRAVGAAGCGSVGCHGGPAAEALLTGIGSWGSSAVVWAAADPHRRAYAVLDGDLAKRMMAALGGGPATDDVRCLACHTNPALAAKVHDDKVALRAEGVGCEACHGNAGGWLQTHRTDRAAAYAGGGLAKLNDLGERALACAGCHVGARAENGYPLRDMNHDMIAAGHPRLNFDFATYQAMLPKHWHERDRSKGGAVDPAFEARAWLVGRVAHAEAACHLTADRATRKAPWPEFGEFACASCHRPIAYPLSRTDVPAGGRRVGTAPYQPIWPVTRPGSLPGAPDLSAFHRPTAADAHKAADALTALRLTLTKNPPGVAEIAALVNGAKSIPAAEWDRDLTEQVFHAAAALARADRAANRDVDLGAYETAACKLTLRRGRVRFDLPAGAADAVKQLLERPR